MQLDTQEETNGVRWFLGAGFLGVCLCLFLYHMDNHMTFSDKEERLAETLYELRSAQTSLSTGPLDSRLIVETDEVVLLD